MILADLLGVGTALLCAILIKYAKLYDLMAGYNMRTKEGHLLILMEAGFDREEYLSRKVPFPC